MSVEKDQRFSGGLRVALSQRENRDRVYRIQRSVESNTTVFALSGDLDSQHVSHLEELLASEPLASILLDLKELRLADRSAVRFLAAAESARIRIINCPDYIRSWMAAEFPEM